MRITVLLIILITSLFSDVIIKKTSFINQANYADKTMDEIKAILLKKVKVDAASEIFGDFIKSETDIENGKVIRNLLISEKNGLVHIKGNPIYTNGKNFGDIQVTVTAYATDKDLQNMSIQKINVNNFIYTNSKIKLKNIKKAAENAFLVYALSQKKPSLKNNPNKVAVARSLSTSMNITKMTFDSKRCAYTMSGYVEYIPFFLKNK